MLAVGYGLDPTSDSVLTVASSNSTYSYALGAMITYADELGWTFIPPAPAANADSSAQQQNVVIGLAVASGVGLAAAVILFLYANYLRNRLKIAEDLRRSPFQGELVVGSSSVEPSPTLYGHGRLNTGRVHELSFRVDAPSDYPFQATDRAERVAILVNPSESSSRSDALVVSGNPLNMINARK